MSDGESIPRTLGVAAAVALVCSLAVSSAVYWLRPIQLAQQSLEQNRAVLAAAGRLAPEIEIDDGAIVDRILEFDLRIVDLQSDDYTNDVAAWSYDFRAAIDDPELSVAIAEEADIAGLGRRPRYMPMYLWPDADAIEIAVLPVYGRGMWSTIHGFVSLGPDLATIVGVHFYEHGETPGIGDRILNADWLAQWSGTRIVDDDDRVVFRIATGEAGGDGAIDGITGATVTVAGIDRFVRYWLGDDAYGPFLATRRREGR